VHLVVVERFLGLRRDAGPVVGQAEGVFQDEVGGPAGVGQGEAHRGHAAGRVAQDRHVPGTEVVQQGRGVRGEQLEAVVDVGLG